MIIFHEGMPGHGKSYAAVVDHILPALKKGRKVYARMNGLDNARISEVTGLSLEEVAARLIPLSHDDVKGIEKYPFDKDALIVIDELQNFWPAGRGQLSEELRTFITEHRQSGFDILCMGQVLKDCHKTWVNRTNRKIGFQKKDVLGKDDEYKWTMYLGKLDQNGVVKFEEVTKGDGKYDPQYFGTYASYKPDADNTETYTDERVVIWNNPIFKKWLPIFGVALACGIGYILFFFNSPGDQFSGKKVEQKPSVQPVSIVETVTDANGVTTTRHIGKVKEEKRVEAKPSDLEFPDYVADLSGKHKIRLATVVTSSARTLVIVEWRDDSNRVVESLRNADIEALGWHVLTDQAGRVAILVKPGARLVATSWPITEIQGKVTDAQTQEIKKLGGAA